MSTATERKLQAAAQAAGTGDIAAAIRACEQALRLSPTLLPALRLLAQLHLRTGQTQSAISVLRRLVALYPNDAEGVLNLGGALTVTGEAEAAIAVLQHGVTRHPEIAAMHFNLANALLETGRLGEALAAVDATVAREPRMATAHNNRGTVLKRMGRDSDALLAFRTARELDPDLSAARNNLGVALAKQGQWDAAVAELEAAIRLDPSNVDAYGSLGQCHLELSRFPEALLALRRALELDPGRASLWHDLGIALVRCEQLPSALAVLEKLSLERPDDTDLLVDLAFVQSKLGHLLPAQETLRQVQALGQLPQKALPTLLDIKLQLCSWQGLDELVARIKELRVPEMTPLALAVVSDEPADLLRTAKEFATELLRNRTPAAMPIRHRQRGRIRVAYVSPDFGDHPVGHSIVELLERHDRQRVEVLGVSLQRLAPTAIGARLQAACDQYIDVWGQDDKAAVAKLREMDIDVAVDLGGYTHGTRPLVLAGRIARVQAGYLGYPGTSGSPWMDYLIADESVVPTQLGPFYSERLVRLTGTFLASDTTQAVGITPTRASAGLPEAGFVFACMTAPSRILPQVFQRWMQTLAHTQDSVLWLRGPAEARPALRQQAIAAGIDPARLVFAERLQERSAYLGRLRLADLCLDNFPYSGHSTVRDALWSGVPVVTLEGKAFQSRVAASLLRAAGLQDWIAQDWSSYDDLAREAARNPARLLEARARLANPSQLALFDTVALARRMESAYEAMMARWNAGQAPDHLQIA